MNEIKLEKEQEKDMVRAWYKEHIDDFMADVRTLFPSIKKEDEDLRKECLYRIWVATEIGLMSGEDVLGFLVLSYRVGLGFYQLPAVKRVLARADLLPDNKIASMMLILPPSYWATARDKVEKLK